MQTDLVSIIIPTYNRAHMLGDALRSVLAQDYPHKQIIVVDDGSTDATRQLVQSFKGVEYHYQPNQGQAAARNTGLRYCRGEFLASLDSDDIWESDFLRAGIECLRQHKLSLVFMNWQASEYNWLDNYCQQPSTQQRFLTQPHGEWWLLTPTQTRQLVLETCPAPSSAMILRRSALAGGWSEQMRIADDWCLLLGLVLRQPTAAAFTLRPHWLKRVHDQNICDGRSYQHIFRDLYFHDRRLMLRLYQQHLTKTEKFDFRRQQAQHYLACIFVSNHGVPNTIALRDLAAAFLLAPLITARHLAFRTYSSVRLYYLSAL